MIDAKQQQHNAVPQADVCGFRRQMTQYEFGRRAVRKPWQKVMFGKPHPLVSELIREPHLLDALVERALDASVGHIRSFEFKEKTQFHLEASIVDCLFMLSMLRRAAVNCIGRPGDK